MICTTVVPVSKGHLGGASPKYFDLIHRGGRVGANECVVCVFQVGDAVSTNSQDVDCWWWWRPPQGLAPTKRAQWYVKRALKYAKRALQLRSRKSGFCELVITATPTCIGAFQKSPAIRLNGPIICQKSPRICQKSPSNIYSAIWWWQRRLHALVPTKRSQ